MNRRLTLCMTLTVLTLFGVWSVHSIAQDLFDSPRDATVEDDTDRFDADSSDDRDLFDSSDDTPKDDLFDDSSDDRPATNDSFNDDTPPGDAVHDFDDIDEPEIDVVEVETNNIRDFGEADDVQRTHIEVTNSGVINLDADPNLKSRRARQQLARHQQTLLQQYMRTRNESTRDSLVERLTDSVQQEFDVRQQERSNELRALERELKRLRSVHVQREREKNSIVRNRVRQLIRDKEGLGWGSESVSRRTR